MHRFQVPRHASGVGTGRAGTVDMYSQSSNDRDSKKHPQSPGGAGPSGCHKAESSKFENADEIVVAKPSVFDLATLAKPTAEDADRMIKVSRSESQLDLTTLSQMSRRGTTAAGLARPASNFGHRNSASPATTGLKEVQATLPGSVPEEDSTDSKTTKKRVHMAPEPSGESISRGENSSRGATPTVSRSKFLESFEAEADGPVEEEAGQHQSLITRKKMQQSRSLRKRMSMFLTGSKEKPLLGSRRERTTAHILNLGFCLNGEGRKSRRAINPESSVVLYWDLWLIFTYVVIALVTPYEVGHCWQSYRLGFEFWFNRHADVVFILDVILVFHLAFFDKSSGLWVFELKKISKKYLRGWLWYDTLTCVPFDLVMLILEQQSLLTLPAEVILRLLRLFRVARLMRATRVPQRISWLISMDFSLMQLLKYILYAVVFAHWIACAWSLVVILERDLERNWVVSFFDMTVMELPESQLYIGSLYWAVMTVSTIGYGDIVPDTSLERTVVIIAMLIGAFAYGYIIGAVSGIVATRDAKRNTFYSTMDGLNHFMENSKLPKTLRVKLREYFTYRCNSSMDIHGYNQLLQAMSPALRSDVAMFINSSWIANVAHFRGCEAEFITQVALHMNHVVFPPAETILEVGERLEHLYIVKRGIAVGRGRLFTTGKVFGEEALYKPGDASFTVRSLTFTDVTYITASSFMELLSNFPVSEVKFRKQAIKALFHEEVLAYCQAYRNVAEELVATGRMCQAISTRDLSQMAQPVGQTEFLTSDMAHRRVQFYEQKLRMFIMVDEMSKAQFNRYAVVIQRKWRSFMAKREAERVKKETLLDTFLSGLLADVSSAPAPAPALGLSSLLSSRRPSAAVTLQREPGGAEYRPDITPGINLEGIPPAGAAEESSQEGEDTARAVNRMLATGSLEHVAPSSSGIAGGSQQQPEVRQRLDAFEREMKLLKQAVQLTAFEVTKTNLPELHKPSKARERSQRRRRAPQKEASTISQVSNMSAGASLSHNRPGAPSTSS